MTIESGNQEAALRAQKVEAKTAAITSNPGERRGEDAIRAQAESEVDRRTRIDAKVAGMQRDLEKSPPVWGGRQPSLSDLEHQASVEIHREELSKKDAEDQQAYRESGRAEQDAREFMRQAISALDEDERSLLKDPAISEKVVQKMAGMLNDRRIESYSASIYSGYEKFNREHMTKRGMLKGALKEVQNGK